MRKLAVGFGVATALVMSACGPSPAEVTKDFTTAINAKNVDSALALVGENATFTMGKQTFTGAEQVRTSLTNLVGQNPSIEVVGQPQMNNNVVTWTEKVTTDEFTKLGVAPVEATVEATVTEGKISAMTWTLTPESMTKVQAAKDAIVKKTVIDFDTAVAAHQVDAALPMFADDASVNWLGTTSTGKEAVKTWLASLGQQNATIEVVGERQVAGGTTVTYTLKITTDEWKKANVAPLDAKAEAMVMDGKMKSFTVTLTPESAAKLPQPKAEKGAPAKGTPAKAAPAKPAPAAGTAPKKVTK